MERDEIQTRKRQTEARYGAWISHNLDLGHSVYSISPEVAGGNEARLRRVVQLVSDLSPVPIDQLRILDLGAFEGLFAVEFARRGAKVVAVEGREASLEKMRLAKEGHGLDNLELYLGDVRGLSRESYGDFDVVLCLGLLYHLDTPDVFRLLEAIREVCKNLLILETRIALSPRVHRAHRGKMYWGIVVDESFEAPALSRDTLWAALDNPQSFHPTRASLTNALADVGYSSMLECLLPPRLEETAKRALFVAFTQPREQIVSVPALNIEPWQRAEEPPVPFEELLRRLPAYRWLEARAIWRVKSLVRRITARFHQ